MTKDQEKHVNKVGSKRYAWALAAATFAVRHDSRLTGSDKIRKEIAEQAALEATGYPRKAFVLSKLCGPPTVAAETAAQEAFAHAYEAACKAVPPANEQVPA